MICNQFLTKQLSEPMTNMSPVQHQVITSTDADLSLTDLKE